MSTSTDPRLRLIAQDCVDDMGDIFWDYDPGRDKVGDYTDPQAVAVGAVEGALERFAEWFDMSDVYPRTLRDEYETLIGEVGEDATDERIVGALVGDADWTERGAREVLQLAQQYGTSILRNALALAAAMNIEDGEAGF